MIYCDSSFLCSLYVSSDVFNDEARRAVSSFADPIPYTLLNELELLTALFRSVGSRAIKQYVVDSILDQLMQDEADGLLKRAAVNQVRVFEKARKLSRNHAASLACRSLDILHVATAWDFGLSRFASFDVRQRRLAAAIGLRVVPRKMPVAKTT